MTRLLGSVPVARSVALGTVQVLRPGPQGEAASHAAVPGMDGQGQLRMYRTSAEHAAGATDLQLLLLLFSGKEEEKEEPAAHRKLFNTRCLKSGMQSQRKSNYWKYSYFKDRSKAKKSTDQFSHS